QTVYLEGWPRSGPEVAKNCPAWSDGVLGPCTYCTCTFPNLYPCVGARACVIQEGVRYVNTSRRGGSNRCCRWGWVLPSRMRIYDLKICRYSRYTEIKEDIFPGQRVYEVYRKTVPTPFLV